MNKEIEEIKETRRWVIKIGSALITDNGCGLKHDVLDSWVGQISPLTERGIDIVIVGSGLFNATNINKRYNNLLNA